ncbi:hypothetical protein CesoFtcFv8_002870 [Champsocephalus esox]|uniref:Uncharacterized protein n=2 Tax=Champsocephalus TaxID=52236 RepID=A0AAN8E7I7_CHAGU|nr:hypothetical protein CesoFtcFv8_002870 [Champsocephalus esox]KAK5934547.1 hypothetical protein CgunFtcFv8_014937 [Champsocephalus gunnari]
MWISSMSLRYRVKWASALKDHFLVIVPGSTGQLWVFPHSGSYTMRCWEWCGLMGRAIDPIQHQCPHSRSNS